MSTESEQSAGQGYPPTWQLREHGIPVSLSMDTSVWWSGDLFSAMRTTLGADRSREHLEAHGRQETVTHCHLRAEDVVDWATRGGAKALGLDSVIGSLEAGKKADVVLIKNDASPVMFPLLNPYGHVAFQAQRGDVHTVVVNGRVVKHDAPAGRVGPGPGPAGGRADGRVPAGPARARRPGPRACTRRSRRPRCSTTRTPTPSGTRAPRSGRAAPARTRPADPPDPWPGSARPPGLPA